MTKAWTPWKVSPKRRKPTPVFGYPERIRSDNFERIAWAAIQSLASVEGWAGDQHPSAKIDCEDSAPEYRPTRAFKAELRRRLFDFNLRVNAKSDEM